MLPLPSPLEKQPPSHILPVREFKKIDRSVAFSISNFTCPTTPMSPPPSIEAKPLPPSISLHSASKKTANRTHCSTRRITSTPTPTFEKLLKTEKPPLYSITSISESLKTVASRTTFLHSSIDRPFKPCSSQKSVQLAMSNSHPT